VCRRHTQRMGGHEVSAVLSADRKYRYRLTREFGHLGDVCCFIMLNPSTADEVKDDPTIRRCVDFAGRFGCGTLEVVNLFALRATDPKELYVAGHDAIGPENDHHIIEACKDALVVVCAWGNHGSYLKRDKEVLALLHAQNVSACALKINAKTSQPAHPLYLRADSQPMPMREWSIKNG